MARRVVGKISAAQTNVGASIHCILERLLRLDKLGRQPTWKNTMNKKINRIHAAFPALESVPWYFHWSKASVNKMQATDAKPVTMHLR